MLAHAVVFAIELALAPFQSVPLAAIACAIEGQDLRCACHSSVCRWTHRVANIGQFQLRSVVEAIKPGVQVRQRDETLLRFMIYAYSAAQECIMSTGFSPMMETQTTSQIFADSRLFETICQLAYTFKQP